MTPDQIEKLALNFYCSPYGKANPETYAFIKGWNECAAESKSTIEGLEQEIADLENRLKEVSAIAVDLAGGK